MISPLNRCGDVLNEKYKALQLHNFYHSHSRNHHWQAASRDLTDTLKGQLSDNGRCNISWGTTLKSISIATPRELAYLWSGCEELKSLVFICVYHSSTNIIQFMISPSFQTTTDPPYNQGQIEPTPEFDHCVDYEKDDWPRENMMDDSYLWNRWI